MITAIFEGTYNQLLAKPSMMSASGRKYSLKP
jgi:hypothetical protein